MDKVAPRDVSVRSNDASSDAWGAMEGYVEAMDKLQELQRQVKLNQDRVRQWEERALVMLIKYLANREHPEWNPAFSLLRINQKELGQWRTMFD